MGMRHRFNHVSEENEKLVPKALIISLQLNWLGFDC